VGGVQILLVAAVVVIPLAIAVAVTLWTLEPAAQRAERAKRAQKRPRGIDRTAADDGKEATSGSGIVEIADHEDRGIGRP